MEEARASPSTPSSTPPPTPSSASTPPAASSGSTPGSSAAHDVADRLEAQAERERLARELEQSQRLESLGRLTGGIAHDFNNLLGVILNYAAFVDEALEQADADARTDQWAAVRDDVDQIVRAGERAAALIRQLLAFARREALRPEVVDLNDVVTDVEQLLRHSLGGSVPLDTSLQPDLWPVLADPGKIEQVLVNLALNARDAMPGGGSLTIDTRNMDADNSIAARYPGISPGRCVRVRVSDTGEGMSDDVRRRAFEPFFTTKPASAGTGLGLATVHGIITHAGGSVQIYSEQGMGTTISMLLPVTDQAPAVLPMPPPTGQRGGGETILVVEDEDALRDVTERILTRDGYEVLAAANGTEALELARDAERIDLLLTDVVMPQMLGKELAERIHDDRPGLAVIYMSGYAQPVLASSGSLEPGVILVEKPFSAATLLATVREKLDGHA